MRYAKWVLGVLLSGSLATGCALLIGIEPFPVGMETGSTGSGASGGVGDGSGTGGGGTGGTNCLNVNDCKKEQAQDKTGLDPVDIPIAANISPLCRLVSAGKKVRFRADDGTCWLRGGTTQSGKEFIQDSNIIETHYDGGINVDTSNYADITIDAGVACIPFFCKEDPALRRGVIFVQ